MFLSHVTILHRIVMQPIIYFHLVLIYAFILIIMKHCTIADQGEVITPNDLEGSNVKVKGHSFGQKYSTSRGDLPVFSTFDVNSATIYVTGRGRPGHAHHSIQSCARHTSRSGHSST